MIYNILAKLSISDWVFVSLFAMMAALFAYSILVEILSSVRDFIIDNWG